MRVIRDRPPLFDEIDKVFKVRGKPVVFAWGDRIYAPSGNGELHGAIIAHERAHCERQLAYALTPLASALHESLGIMTEARIMAWWGRYLTDINFRREEEIIGHRAELEWLVTHAGGRNQRRRHMSIVATKLSNPLYGPLMNKATARKVLDVSPAQEPARKVLVNVRSPAS